MSAIRNLKSALIFALAMAGAACGKKGPPLAPIVRCRPRSRRSRRGASATTSTSTVTIPAAEHRQPYAGRRRAASRSMPSPVRGARRPVPRGRDARRVDSGRAESPATNPGAPCRPRLRVRTTNALQVDAGHGARRADRRAALEPRALPPPPGRRPPPRAPTPAIVTPPAHRSAALLSGRRVQRSAYRRVPRRSRSSRSRSARSPEPPVRPCIASCYDRTSSS